MYRSEATKIKNTVERAVSCEYNYVKTEACGSYRRKKEMCGDVDILMCAVKGEGKMKQDSSAEIMKNVIGSLTLGYGLDFLVERLGADRIA